MCHTPITSVRPQVYLVLGLAEAPAIAKASRGVRNSLEAGLGGNVVLDVGLEVGVIAVREDVYNSLED